MNTTPATWPTLHAEAEHRRHQLWHHVRRWAARLHVRTHDTPTRVVAALDALRHPMRLGITNATPDPTPREWAEAAGDDLWDAVAVCHSMVKAAAPGSPPLEHVHAELAEAGRWLAAYRVHVAAHDAALAELFTTRAVVVG